MKFDAQEGETLEHIETIEIRRQKRETPDTHSLSLSV